MVSKRLLMSLLGALAIGVTFAQSDGSGYVVQSGSVVDSFESLGWAKWDLGILEFSTSKARSGLTSLKMIASPGEEVLARKAMPLDLTYSTTIGFWVYVDQPAQYDLSTVVGISLSNDDFASEMYASTDNLRQGWNKVVFAWADFKARNGAKWGKFTHVQLRLYDMGWPSTVYFDDLMVGQFTRPKVVISFDDAYDDHYNEAFQYMRSLGLPGTCYINSGFLGREGRLTEVQCQEMYDAGWDMANHTENHANLTLLTPAEQEAEIAKCRNFMISKGWTRRNGHLHFAYPYGFYNSDTFSALANTGTLTARTTWEARQANVLDERYLLYGQLPENIRTTPSDLISMLDHFVLAGGLFEVSYHMIVTWDPENSNQIRQSEFREVIDYIAYLKAQGVIDVITKSEWYEGLAGAGLTGVTLDRTQVVGGQPMAGTVALGLPAESGGVVVTLASSSWCLVVPSTVTVPQGSTSVGFAITTKVVTTDKNVTVTATKGTVVKTASVLVRPAVALSAVYLNPLSVSAGQTSTMTVNLNRPADTDFVVTLTSSNSNITVPTTLTIPANSGSGTVTVSTKATITSNQTSTLAAKANGITKTAKLTVISLPVLQSLTVNDNDVKGGQTITGTVWMSKSAPSGGCVVTLPPKSYVSMPATVTVPSGSSKVSFTITTSTVTSKKVITLEAIFNGVTKTRTLTIRP